MVSRLAINFLKNSAGVKSILQVKPAASLPEKMIFQVKRNHYAMFDRKSREPLGLMHAYITEWPPSRSFYPKIKEAYKVLYIDGLEVNKKFQGAGREFINLAKNISKNSPAEGRINLLAWCLDDSKVCPQIFYHKMGFTTANKKHLAEIKRLEATGTKNPKLFGDWNVSTNMYLEV